VKVPLALAIIGLALISVGTVLWVDAGTRHMDELPQSSAVLISGGQRDDGPNRLPAHVVWAGAAICIVGAAVYRTRD
jgi:hypothetical protein